MTPEEYFEKGKFIWKNYVPKSGQSKYVQGELLRAVEKLRDEALRNGNGNWDQGHVILVDYIRETLIKSGCFDSKKNKEIIDDTNRLLNYNYPYTENDIYDRLCDRVVDFFIHNPEPIKNTYNENLYR